jgi:tetratricopeptide (TPR) repeat protein
MRNIFFTLALVLCACALAAASQTRTILVFPFENQSSSSDLGWISEAFAEVLSRRLAGPHRFLLSRDELNTAYKQYGIPPNTTLTLATEYKVAETLGVDWAVVGRFKVVGQQLTADAQLLDLPSLRLYPAIEESGALTDLIRIQTRIVWTILKRYDTDFHGGSEEDFARLFPPLRLDAFEDYIRGILAQDAASKIEFLSAAARLNPTDHRAAFALGQQYFRQKDYSNSAYWFQKLNAQDSNYLKSLFLRGVDDFFLGNDQAAETAFKILASELPLNEVSNDLGVLEARSGDYEAALSSFKQSYHGDPADPTYSYNLGACYSDLKQYQEAIVYLEKALADEPGDLGIRTLLAYALNKQGDPAGSRAQLRWVSEHDGRAMANLNANILPQPRIKKTYNGEAFRLLSVTVDNSLEAKLAKLPRRERARVHMVRGNEFIKEGLWPDAIRELTEAVSLMPDNSAAYLFLGQAYELQGAHQKAVEELQTSLKLDNSAVTHLWLAHAYFSLRQFPQALDESQAALSLDPGDPDAERLIDSIQQQTKNSRNNR